MMYLQTYPPTKVHPWFTRVPTSGDSSLKIYNKKFPPDSPNPRGNCMLDELPNVARCCQFNCIILYCTQNWLQFSATDMTCIYR